MRSYAFASVLLASAVLVLSGCETIGWESKPPEVKLSYAELETLKSDSELAYSEKRWRDAAAGYSKLTEEIPAEANYWFKLGTSEARLDHPQASIAALQEAIVRQPGLSKAWFNMSVVELRRAEHALFQLQEHAEEDDPIAMRAEQLLFGLSDLLERFISATQSTDE